MTGHDQNRQRWRRVCDAAAASARSPGDLHAAVALKQVLRGLSAASFPLAAGDVRLQGVAAFLALYRLWIASGADTRTAFAASLAALADDLERILLAQGADVAQAHLRRQGLG